MALWDRLYFFILIVQGNLKEIMRLLKITQTVSGRTGSWLLSSLAHSWLQHPLHHHLTLRPCPPGTYSLVSFVRLNPHRHGVLTVHAGAKSREEQTSGRKQPFSGLSVPSPDITSFFS
jgi:hypothetical protein